MTRIYLDRHGKCTTQKPKPTRFMAPVGTPMPASWFHGDMSIAPESWKALPPLFKLITSDKITPRIKQQIDLIDWRRGGY